MALPKDYSAQSCSVARSLEVIGERWTMLIVRDAFYGVRRFSDFVTHLDIPRAVLTARLAALVEEGVLARVPGSGRRDEYELTDKGLALWPVLRSLTQWGDQFYSPAGPRRITRHADDDGRLDAAGVCERCGTTVAVSDTVIEPGPGFEGRRTDPVSVAFGRRRRLLDPITA